MNAQQFVDHLKEKALLEESILEQLRQLIAQIGRDVTPEELVKLLVEEGHLTRFQGSKLLSDLPAMAESQQDDDYALKHDSLDGDQSVSPKRDQAPEEEEPIIDLTGDGAPLVEEEEIVDLEQAVVPAAPVAAAPDPLMDPLATPASQPAVAADPNVAAPPPDAEPITDDQAPSTLAELAVEKSPWDTKLIVLGSASFGLMGVLGFFLYLSITSHPPAEMLSRAQADYNAGSYTQSIGKYEDFIKRYPGHDEASLARARIGMSKILQVASTPDKALERCQKILPELQKEEKFNQVRDELALLLPNIVESFVDAALKSGDLQVKQTNLDLSVDAMKLVDTTSYIPASRKKGNAVLAAQLERIKEKTISLNRHIDRTTELNATIKEMEASSGQGNTRQAFNRRQDLLREFPELENDAILLNAVLRISESEQQLVKASASSEFEVSQQDHQLAAEDTVVTFVTSGEIIPTAGPHVAFVLAGGSVYGVEVRSGKVLWRRFVGFETIIHPRPVSADPAADALVVDGKRHELLRLDARSGALKWRLALNMPFSDPLLINGQAVVNTRPVAADDASQMLRVDLQSGAVAAAISFPMQVQVPPAYDVETNSFFQVGQHSNLYVVSAESNACTDVLYASHSDGGVQVGPVAAVGYVVICENVEEDRSLVRIFQTDKTTGKVKIAQRPISLKGKVVVPPIQYDRRVLVATDLGEIRVYEVDPNISPPVQEMAGIAASFTAPVIQFPLVDQGQLWIGGKQFARYKIQAVLGELTLDWIDNDGDEFVAPLQRHDTVVVHARKQQGATAFTISGQPSDARRPSWQTAVGGTASVSLDQQNNQLSVLTSQAGLFRFDTPPAGLQYQLETVPQGVDRQAAYSRPVELAPGRIVMMGSSTSRSVLFAASGDGESAQHVGLEGSRGRAFPATAFGGQLLVPFDDGAIRLYHMPSGSQQVMPFQPSLRPGEKVVWSAPAVHADPTRGFVVMRDNQQLFGVQVQQQPRQHLAMTVTKPLQDTVYPQMAALGDHLYAVTRGEHNDVLLAYDWETLEEVAQWDVDRRVIWGPWRVDNRLLLLTDNGKLCCLQPSTQTELLVLTSMLNGIGRQHVFSWQADVKSRQIASQPLAYEGDYFLVSLSGSIWRIAGDSGAVVAHQKMREPLQGRPAVFADRLWLSGPDGAIHVIPVPERQGGSG